VPKAADRAGTLTNRLLAFRQRQIMRPRVMNLNAVVGQTEKMIGEGVELVMGLSPDIGNMIADPNHIEQAIVNLMVNASDAMPFWGPDHDRNRQRS
jgi:nitrogen-specific signal transduction histidine kinase